MGISRRGIGWGWVGGGGSVEGGRGPKVATCMRLTPIHHDAPRGPAAALLPHAALRKGGVPCLLVEGLT